MTIKFNTEEEVRGALGLSDDRPASSILTHWQSIIQGIITAYNSDSDSSGARAIELNRIGKLWAPINPGRDHKVAITPSNVFPPLTDDEKLMLNGYVDSGVDSISVNGKRRNEVYGGRR